MAIKHPTVKVPGNTLAAVTDWNANHTIDPGTILRSATLIVAASDSLDTTNADYFCDGTADEVQINQAISDLPATGGSVCLMDGTFDIDASILMNKDNVSLIGQGKATKISTDDTIKMVACETNRSYLLIKDIQFSGVNINGCYGIYLDAFYCMITNCWFRNLYEGISVIEDFNIIMGCYFFRGTYGIRNNGGYYNNYTACTFNDVGSCGIDISSGYYNPIVSNSFYSCTTGVIVRSHRNTITGNSGNGCGTLIHISGDRCTIVGNSSYNCSTTIFASGSDNLSIMGNTGDSNGIYFIHLTSCKVCSVIGNSAYYIHGTQGILLSNSNRCNINGNTLRKVDNHGISIEIGNHNVINGNNIYNCSQSINDTYSGIFLGYTSTYNVVSNNRISADAANKHKYGIREAAAADDYNCVTGNICTDAVTADISLQGANSEEAHNITS